MKQLLLLPAIFCAFLSQGLAQSKIAVNAPVSVNQMMDQFIQLQKATTSMTGWRIQLLATTDRQEMESALYRFKALYPYIRVDWVHATPYYKIQAGAFKSKLESYRILYLIKRDYPGAYPAIDNSIKPEEFLY